MSKFMIGILESWEQVPSQLSFVSPVRGQYSRVNFGEGIADMLATESSELSQALQDGSIRPEIWAIEEGSTKNHNRYQGRKLIGGSPDPEGNPSGVQSWFYPFPKPILVNHDLDVDPLGRVMTPEDAKYVRRNGKGGIYIYPEITQPEGIGKVFRREYMTGSIGTQSDSAVCSICGHDIVAAQEPCDHWKGRRYKNGSQDPKGEMAEWILGNLWFQEYSFVNQPAKSTSGVTRVNTKEAFEAYLQSHGDIVMSSESVGKRTCYNCQGDGHVCDGKGKCLTEPQEAFYIVKLDTPRIHYWMPKEYQTTAGSASATTTTKEGAAMVKLVIPAGELIEAKLSSAARNKLPDSAFCGPGRSYPAHDAAHVRNGLARLSQFGARMPAATRAKVLGCLRSRASKFGIKAGGADKKEMVLLTGDEANAWIEQYCASNSLKDAYDILAPKTEAEIDAMLATAWAEADSEGVREAEREEMQKQEEFLKSLPENVFCGPNRSFPVINYFAVQVARAELSWPNVREKMSEAQRAQIANKIDELEQQLDESGEFATESAITKPEWLEWDDPVTLANMIETAVPSAVEGFKTGESTETDTTTPCPNCKTHAEALTEDAKEQIARLEDQASVLREQNKQLHAELDALKATSESQKQEIAHLQEQNAELGANTHKELLDRLVMAKIATGTKRTEEQLREHYAKMSVETLRDMLDDVTQETSATATTLPAARPATESGTAPVGASVESTTQDAPPKDTPKVSRFEQAVQATGATKEAKAQKR